MATASAHRTPDMPWVVRDETQGLCVWFESHGSAMSYAYVAGQGHAPGRFMVYDSRKPHMAYDTESTSHAVFDGEARARAYVTSNNRYQGRERFTYKFLVFA